jgi:uncharacterized membrane protein YdjX (TVP38/TMEM64 family)
MLQAPRTNPEPPRRWWPRLALALILLAVIAALALSLGNEEVFERLVQGEDRLRAIYREHPAATLAVAGIVYVVVTGLSIPGALPLSLSYGWLFGYLPAVVLVSFASTAGATLAFLLSRFLVGRWVQERFGGQLSWFNAAVERDGAAFLITLRLMPPVPFWLVNLLAGLTKMRVTTFWWASQLGMLPGTLVFIYVGASAPSLRKLQEEGLGGLVDWNVLAALTLAGVFPLAVRWLVRRLQRGASPAERTP